MIKKKESVCVAMIIDFRCGVRGGVWSLEAKVSMAVWRMTDTSALKVQCGVSGFF
jgi:hypothetical protein